MLPMNQRVLGVLWEAHNLIALPGTWTQRAVARDVNGARLPSRHPDAVCWCPVGALMWATYIDFDRDTPGEALTKSELFREASEAINRQIPGYDDGQRIYGYNDAAGRTQQEVLDLFIQAIAKLTSEMA